MRFTITRICARTDSLMVHELRFRLEQEHSWRDAQESVFATRGPQVVPAPDRVHRPRNRGHVIGKVLRGDRHSWMMPVNGLRGPPSPQGIRCGWGPFSFFFLCRPKGTPPRPGPKPRPMPRLIAADPFAP